MWGQVAGGLASAGMGMLLAGADDNRQLRQQEKINAQQMKYQKEMGRYNQEMGLKMWNDTNAEAQAQHYKNAGLNVGLMYGGSGAGGATTNTAAGSGSGQAAPTRETGTNAMGMGLQMANMQAQNELIKAQTEKTKVETTKTAGVDTELTGANVQATIAKALEQQMNNEYMGKGAYKDGMSGYEVRYQQEAAQMYKTVADTEVQKLNLEQMPTRLQNEVQKVILEGQRVAIDAINAKTAQERNALTERVEALKRNLAITMQGAELERKDRTTALGEDALNRTMQQKDEDQLMQMVDKVMSAAVPWYEPSTSTTTNSRNESYDKDGNYNGGTERSERTIRKRN